MPGSFNPYQQWLELEEGREPSNHYELLGLGPLESDPEVIARAADTMMSRIRRVRPGPHLAQWQQLLDHLKEVKTCLLDPLAKAAYDATLQAGTSNTPVPAEEIVAPDGGAQSAIPTAEVPEIATAIPRRPSRRKTFTLVTGLLSVAIIAGLGFYVLNKRPAPPTPSTSVANNNPNTDPNTSPIPDPNTPPIPDPTPAEVSRTPAPIPESPVPETNGSPKPAGTVPVHSQASPLESTPKPMPEPTLPIDPAKQAVLIEALDATRASMANRDLTTARRYLESAVAQTPAEEARRARVETLLDYLDQFWGGIDQSVAEARAGQELAIGETIIIVVEASPGRLVLRARGRDYTYATRELPHSVVLKLAETWFDDVPSSKVFLGAYLAVDSQGDRDRARQLWLEAARQGLDLEAVMPELDVTPPPDALGTAAPATDPTHDADRLDKAVREVREIFQADYARATTSRGKADLASKLLESASTLHDDPMARLAMLREAKQTAVGAGKAALACKAVDQLSHFDNTDPITERASVLALVVRNVQELEGQREFVQTAIESIHQALEQDSMEEARQLTQLATQIATRSKSAALAREARAVSQQVEAMSQRGME